MCKKEGVMSVARSIKLVTLLSITLLVGCIGEKDFCKYLPLAEAQAYDPSISKTEMRQTKKILYCVYKSATSDRLFISMDTVMKHSPREFLKVLAKNSPEQYSEVRPLSGFSNDGAALFLGDEENQLRLDFLIVQNRKYLVVIRAPDVMSTNSENLDKLNEIASKVLSRI
jgi:hypothetical protein